MLDLGSVQVLPDNAEYWIIWHLPNSVGAKLKEFYYNKLQAVVLVPYLNSEMCCVKWV
jgi:hypothetical protein